MMLYTSYQFTKRRKVHQGQDTASKQSSTALQAANPHQPDPYYPPNHPYERQWPTRKDLPYDR